MSKTNAAKSATAKSNVQFIKAPGGGDLAILPRGDYDRLVALAREAEEDAADANAIRKSRADLAAGREVILPQAVVKRIAAGESPIRVLREWRSITQSDLAGAAGISQNYLSGIENGTRKGPGALQKKLASALGVPVDLLI